MTLAKHVGVRQLDCRTPYRVPFAAIVGRRLVEAVQIGAVPATLALLRMERVTLL